jgi:hypothetical protein
MQTNVGDTTREVLDGSMFITSGIEAVMNGYNGGDPGTESSTTE